MLDATMGEIFYNGERLGIIDYEDLVLKMRDFEALERLLSLNPEEKIELKTPGIRRTICSLTYSEFRKDILNNEKHYTICLESRSKIR